MSFGSTKDEDPIPKEEFEKLMVRKERATVHGVQQELEIVKQQLENCHEQMRVLVGLYGTLQQQFEAFNRQRVQELNVRVNGGPTGPTHGDLDRSSNESNKRTTG